MRFLLFLIPVAVAFLAVGHNHAAGLSPGHVLLHTVTVIIAAALLYIAISGYARVRSSRFLWLLIAFVLLLTRELSLSLSMYLNATWLLPHTDIPIDHFLGLLALVTMAYALFKT